MAQVTWTEPALSDLDEIAEYIALDNPGAAHRFVKKYFLLLSVLNNSRNQDVSRQSWIARDIGKSLSGHVESFIAVIMTRYIYFLL